MDESRRTHRLNALKGLALAFAANIAWAGAPAAARQTVYDYEIVAIYPHDPEAYTQGLFYLDGALYETTGLRGRSSLRKIDLESGEILQRRELPAHLFGEGATHFKDRIIQVTWRAQTGFVYDLENFRMRREFSYSGEGWGLAQDGDRLIMSDGTSALRFLDPETLEETGRVRVSYGDKPIARLNELEYVKGEVFANIWRSDLIVRIDPDSGAVVGVVDLRGLRNKLGDGGPGPEVLNGIAYDQENDRLFVTGKFWPSLFEIRLIRREPSPE